MSQPQPSDDRSPPEKPPVIATAMRPDPEHIADVLAGMTYLEVQYMLHVLQTKHGIRATLTVGKG